MGIEIVACSNCGDEYRVQMHGPHNSRDWKVKNWNGICKACRAAENEKAAQANRDAGLVALKGSWSQIAWAETIRNEMVPKIRSWAEKQKDGTNDMAIDTVTEMIVSAESAEYWIGCRDDSPSAIHIHFCRENEEKIKQKIAEKINIEEEK